MRSSPEQGKVVATDDIQKRLVDAAVRQAVLACLSMLPRTERTLQRVEREIVYRLHRDFDTVMAGVSVGDTRSLYEQGIAAPTWDERMARIRTAHPNAYERWTQDEDDLLRQRFMSGATIAELAALHHRQPGAIRSRLKKLGLLT